MMKSDPQYDSLELVDVRYGDERSDKGYQEAFGLVKSLSEPEIFIAYSSVGIAAAARMVEDDT